MIENEATCIFESQILGSEVLLLVLPATILMKLNVLLLLLPSRQDEMQDLHFLHFEFFEQLLLLCSFFFTSSFHSNFKSSESN